MSAADIIRRRFASENDMKYVSTRGGVAPIPFKEAVMMGLARDGGLLLPESFPDVRDRLADWAKLSYESLAFEVVRLFADDIPADDLRAIVRKSYATFSPVPPAPDQAWTGPEVAPVRPVGPVHVLELFHGPTLAFKDFALQFLGNLFEYVLGEGGRELNVVVATSGDTGSAAIHGLRGRKGVRVFVLHPAGRVSPVQELQMTSVLDDNVFNIALAGTGANADMVYAFPEAVISPVNIEAAAFIMAPDMMKVPVEQQKETAEKFAAENLSAYNAAQNGYADGIVEEPQLRSTLIAALDMLAGKRVPTIAKKHSTV